MKRILVAVDLTESAAEVLRAAIDLARPLGGKIRIFHAVQMPAPVPPPGVFVGPPALDVGPFVTAAERALRDLERLVPDELRDGVCVEIGHAAECLCDLARRYDPDLVVIGAHEHGSIARALGTTAARIVNRVDRPVFVVRPMPSSRAVEQTCRRLARLVVFCLDGAAGYRAAAATVKAPERLHRWLASKAEERDEAVDAFRRELVGLGHEPSRRGSLEGAAHRRLLAALAAFAPDAPDAIHAVLRECERGELRTIRAFHRALERPLPEGVEGVVRAELARVVAASAAIRRELVALEEAQGANRADELGEGALRA